MKVRWLSIGLLFWSALASAQQCYELRVEATISGSEPSCRESDWRPTEAELGSNGEPTGDGLGAVGPVQDGLDQIAQCENADNPNINVYGEITGTQTNAAGQEFVTSAAIKWENGNTADSASLQIREAAICPTECDPESQQKNVAHEFTNFARWREAKLTQYCDGEYEWTTTAESDVPAMWLGSQSAGGGTVWMDQTCTSCAEATGDAPAQGARAGGSSTPSQCATNANGKQVCVAGADSSCPGGVGVVDGERVCAQVPPSGDCVTAGDQAFCASDAPAPADGNGNALEPDMWGGAPDGSIDSSDGDGDGQPGDGQLDLIGIYGGGGTVGEPGGSGEGSGEGEGEGEGCPEGTGCEASPDELPDAEWDVREIDESDLGAYQDQLPAQACPADQIEVFGVTVEIPYEPMCEFAIEIRPLVAAAAWLISIFIVVRAR